MVKRQCRLSSYGPEKNFMPEEELRNHRKLEDSSLDLCPARKSAWYVRLIIGNLSVLCLKRVALVWYGPDLVYVVSCFQPSFPQLDCIHVGCTSFCVWELDCVSGHRDKSRQHQGRTPLPPCFSFCPNVGIWTADVELPKGLITSASMHNHCMNMPITLPTPTLHILCSPSFNHLPLDAVVGNALCIIQVFVLFSCEFRLRLKWGLLSIFSFHVIFSPSSCC